MRVVVLEALKRALCAFLIIHFTFCANAQSPATASDDEGAFESAWNDFGSPFTTKARPLAIGGAAIVTMLAILEDQIADPLQEEATETKHMGTFAHEMGVLAGSLAPNVLYAAGMLGYGLFADNSTARDRGNLMARATIYSQGLTLGLKHIVKEERPDKSEKVSFPSAHTSSAFSFASVIGAEHAWYWGALAYSYATVVGYSRMNDNRHWFHDVIGGMVIGVSYGLALHERIRGGVTPTNGFKSASVQLLPSEHLDGAFIAYTLRF